MLPILFLIIQCVLVIYLLYYIITFISGAPFVPSTKNASEAMIRIANIQKSMIVYDLGSGDGRLLCQAARKGATAIGYELNPILVLYSTIYSIKTPRVHIKWKSLWHADIRDADVVFVYLLPVSLDTLKEKLLKELRPGAIVVSNSFVFKNWKITRQDKKNHIFVFTVPKSTIKS